MSENVITYATPWNDEITKFFQDEWRIQSLENYRHIVKEGNPMYEYDCRALLMLTGCSPDALKAVRDEALSYLDADIASEYRKRYDEYVKPAPPQKNKRQSKKQIAEMAKEEAEHIDKPAVPVFGQINPLPKKRSYKKKS